MTDTLTPIDEDRKTLAAADLKALDDSDFAYIDSNGDRHLPIHDEAHVRAALSRFNQTAFDSAADKTAAAKKIVAKAKTFGIEVDPDSAVGQAAGLKQSNSAEEDDEERAQCPTCSGSGKIMDGHRKCPDCGGTGQRNDPTEEDKEVSALLVEAKDVLDRLRAAQKSDPDGDSDPDDAAVSKSIDKAAAALDKAGVAQAADNKPERSRRKPRKRSAPLAPEFRRGIGREIRLVALPEGLEVRESSLYGSNTIEVTGTPIVYNAPYVVRDMFGEFEETMMPGVATHVLEQDCRFLFNHDGLPLARSTSGTLKFTDGPDSLACTAVLDTRQQAANDLVIAIERGDVSQMSVGFVVADDKWSDDWSTREIFRFDELLDVSAVTYPASPTTSIDIANRMMMEVPVESRARIRKLWSIAANEIRAGKVLSSENADHLTAAAKALQAVLDNAGVGENPGGDDGETSATEDDGSRTGPVPNPSTGGDASGSRGRATATKLQLELDLLNSRRRR